jgi:recombination protein RecT
MKQPQQHETENKSLVIGTVKNLRDLLLRQQGAFADVAPKHLDVDRMIKIGCSAFSRQPQLLRCTTRSVLLAMMQAAELGLDPGGVLGDAYLVPIKNNKIGAYECHLWPGYRGLVKLARQSGIVSTIGAEVVYRCDGWSFERTHEDLVRFRHTPNLDSDERTDGNIRLVYAWARVKDGELEFLPIPVREIERIRQMSRGRDEGPWVDHYAWMAKKTALKQLCKTLPLSTHDLAKAIELDNRNERGEETESVNATLGLVPPPELPEEPTVAERVASKVREKFRAATSEQSSEPAPPPDEIADRAHEPGEDG